jgi:hypothetical protein
VPVLDAGNARGFRVEMSTAEPVGVDGFAERIERGGCESGSCYWVLYCIYYCARAIEGGITRMVVGTVGRSMRLFFANGREMGVCAPGFLCDGLFRGKLL